MAMAGISPMDTGLSSTTIMAMGNISDRSSASSKTELARKVRRRQRACSSSLRAQFRCSVTRLMPRMAMSKEIKDANAAVPQRAETKVQIPVVQSKESCAEAG